MHVGGKCCIQRARCITACTQYLYLLIRDTHRERTDIAEPSLSRFRKRASARGDASLRTSREVSRATRECMSIRSK